MLLLCLAILVVYANSLTGPFLFDSVLGITESAVLRASWPGWHQLLTAPAAGGRPLLTLSLWLNYALHGLSPFGYHLVNLLTHLSATLLLYGVVRRTLQLQKVSGTSGRPKVSDTSTSTDAERIAFATALLWSLHPLQTQSVTYVIQRAESLMGLCYLATLYCVCRSASSMKPRPWWVLAMISCAAGMSSKAVMITAPLLTLMYDRVFLAGSWRSALRQRAPLYVGLAATWGWLAYLIQASGAASEGSVGASVMAPLAYLRSQPGVMLYYLKLIVWPHPLIFDYAWPAASTIPAVLWPALAVALLLLLIARAWKRSPALGFLGISFFLLLAPTSTLFPIADVAAEHRLYLPLAPAITLLVLIGRRLLPQRVAPWVAIMLAVSWSGLTILRNLDYRDETRIWQETIAKRPLNARAYNNLGLALLKQARTDEAMVALRESIRLNPNRPEAYQNLGNAFVGSGNLDEAMRAYDDALRIKPDFAEAHMSAANILVLQGKLDEAIRRYKEAVQMKPGDAAIHINLGTALALQGQVDQAITQFREVLRIDPSAALAHYKLANLLAKQGQRAEAIMHYQRVLRLSPRHADAHNNLAALLAEDGKFNEAEDHYRQALAIKPEYAEAHNNFGVLLAQIGRAEDAKAHFEDALRLKPNYPSAHNNLGLLLQSQGKMEEAQQHFELAPLAQ
ncbi:MAG: tetratricopeptide repeat protein [Candidatus Omnitrophica bacterium]|nr:tetratricopeptide repeat protein [Candidatus Omnitrophota bacterium]